MTSSGFPLFTPLVRCRAFHLGLLLLVASHASARSWTDLENRSISAQYLSQTDTHVTLRLTANQREFSIPKEKLRAEDRAHLEFLAQYTFGRSFPVDASAKSSPAYLVVDAASLFRIPGNAAASWVPDLDLLDGQPPAPVDSPMLVEAGIMRLRNLETRQKLIILGSTEFDLLLRVSQLPFFDKLRLQERQALMAVLAAEQLEHGPASREAVRSLFDDESFSGLSEREQGEELLNRVEASSPDLQRNFAVVEFHQAEPGTRWRKESRYTAFQIDDPVVAWENEIRVSRVGRVPVFSLRENDTTGLEAIQKSLSCLPPEMIKYLGVVSLHYRGEGFWWGGGNQIYYVAPEDLQFNGALVYVIAHEIGHCIHAQEVRGAWNDALQNCIVFPSAYGLTNIMEDFAEFTAIVTRAWTRPREMLEVEEVFPWRYQIYCRAVGYDRSQSRLAEVESE